jgi:hypothetical protein
MTMSEKEGKVVLLSNQEAQLIHMLREEAEDGFRLEISVREGAWDIFMSSVEETRKGKKKTLRGRGVGPNFDRAWDDVAGLQF